MIADSERREVARRLREYASWYVEEDCLVDCADWGERVLNLLGCGDMEGECYATLADLIEPPFQCPYYDSSRHYCSVHERNISDRDALLALADEMFGEMRHSTKEEEDAYDAMLKSKSVEIHPVDRDALLALADELEEDACWEVQTPGNTSVARRLKDTCDRIREALGVYE